jgi:hypothetical protein
MSDFLSNVTARALGTSEVVQPRIPSLFEPYRANDGPFVTRTASSLGDAAPGLEERASRMQPPTPVAAPFHSHAPAPPRQAQFAPRDSTATEDPAPTLVTGEQITHHSAPPRAAQAFVRSAATVHERASSAAPSEVSLLNPAQSNSTRLETAPPEVPDSAPQPVAKPAVRPPIAHAMESTSGNAVPSLRRAVDSGSSLLTPRLRVAQPVPPVNAPQAIAPANESTANAQQHFPAAKSDFDARPDFFDRQYASLPTQTPPQESLSRPTSPVQTAQPTPEVRPRTAMEPAVRPPVAFRAGAAKGQAESSAARTTEPPIQVTIGTVEVRAVFPEKPAPRVLPRRPKPGVSLDEYLKKSSRGPR